ncbi:hypothetical protein, partial [Salmonella enterica]|uniref:hypothetical protein n=1 Tax=Salmonella enterica TaxID=28901 RepID=UPI003EDBC372
GAFVVSVNHYTQMEKVINTQDAIEKAKRYAIVRWITDSEKIEASEIKVYASKESEHLSFCDLEWGIYK